MSRAWIAVVVGAALLAAAGAYLWWTAAPAGDEAALLAALDQAPAADGRVALAQPRRAARWLLRHPQALVLLAAAAPDARAALLRLQPLLRPLVGGAQGPLVVWWAGRDVAVATRLRPGTVTALSLLAARNGLVWDADGDLVRVATAAALLAPVRAAPLPAGTSRLAALADAGGRRWRLVAGRERLAAVSGAAVDLERAAGPSLVESLDAAPLARAAGVPAEGAALPLRAVFAPDLGWGVAIGAEALPRLVRDAVRGSAAEGGAARQWNGLLGDVWVRGEDGRVLVATGEALLAQVAAPPAVEQGRVTGRDLAWLTAELAAALERLPLLDREARALHAASGQVAGLGAARWRATAAGAAVELEW
jgi:hypothetical protein